jgi:hypothetical protein
MFIPLRKPNLSDAFSICRQYISKFTWSQVEVTSNPEMASISGASAGRNFKATQQQ